MDAKQTLVDWLINVEKTLIADEFQITFLPLLEERLKRFKELLNDINEQKVNYEYIQRAGEEILIKQSNDTNLRNDLKSLHLRYTNACELITDRIYKLEKAINDVKQFNDEYQKTYQWLQSIDDFMQREQTALGDIKLLYQQVEQCKNITKDLETIKMVANKLNDTVKHLYITTQPNSDSKYLNKIKSDMHELNEKLIYLQHLNSQLESRLEDALKQTAKVDDEIENIDNWIDKKDRELHDDESIVILSEEQFYEKYNRYKEIKNEIDRKESQVKRVFDTGNDMLKNSNGTTGIAADLARNMINLNTKWSNLCKKADSKFKYFNDIAQMLSDLKRKFMSNGMLERLLF